MRALAGDVVLKLNRLKADIKSSVDHLETIQRRLHTLASSAWVVRRLLSLGWKPV